MEESILVDITMTKRRDLVFISMEMAEHIWEIGPMEDNMNKEFIFFLMVI